MRLDRILFIFALGIYAFTRLYRLADFPITFFADEAVNTVIAADLVRDQFWGPDRIFLPTYFENAFFYSLSTTVYLQVIPYLLFGKSLLVTRAVPALITIGAAIGISLMSKQIYRTRFWWAGTLLLVSTPAWFLHSRTAFEAPLYFTFFTLGIYFYLLYRHQDPRFIYPAILLGALGFYSYIGGQLTTVVTALLLFISDFGYHRRNARLLLKAALLGALLAAPYLRFQSQHAGESYYHLRLMDTVILHDIPLQEKIMVLVSNYLGGLDPRYWYSASVAEIPRHLMKGYGFIHWASLPFTLVGLVYALRRWKASEYRTLILLLFVAPLGGILVGVGITRNIIFLLPITLFTVIGLSWLGGWLEMRLSYRTIALGLFVLLTFTSLGLMIDALENGPIWYDDYGIYGMQYGASQVYEAVEVFLEMEPGTHISVSPTWANGSDILKRFFLLDDLPVQMGNATSYLDQMQELDERTVFVLTPHEIKELREDPKVGEIQIARVLFYPNEEPGFYFIRFEYSSEAEAIFAAERAERLEPQQGSVDIDGHSVEIEYPYLDMGEIHHAFDGDPFTLIRVYETNPARFVFDFPVPTTVHGIRTTTGSMDLQLCAEATTEDSGETERICQEFTDLPDDPTVDLSFSAPWSSVTRLVLEINAQGSSVPANIHVREIEID
jgi:hypothetical protein